MSADRDAPHGIPRRALYLECLGYVIAAVGVIPAAILVWIGIRIGFEDLSAFAGALSLGPAGFFLGAVPIMVARHQYRHRPSIWRLWAKMLFVIGGLLCISNPAGTYALAPTMLIGQAATHDFKPISPFNPRELQRGLRAAELPFLLGLILIVPALIWGRRKPGISPALD